MIPITFYTIGLEDNDRNKFEKIYYAYRHILYNHAKSIVINEQDAEDVLQNALFKISNNLHLIDDIKSKKALSYLMVITRNAAIDFLRKNDKKTVSLETAECEDVDDNDIENIASKIDYKELCLLIKNLPSPYSEVLYFHFVYDYSIKDTSKILERPISTVKMQLVRGKKILIERISEVYYG